MWLKCFSAAARTTLDTAFDAHAAVVMLERQPTGRNFCGAIMKQVTIYHNPACKHSRGALELLDSRNVEHETIEYLKTPPDRATLEKIIGMLSDPPSEMVRDDKRFKELGLKMEDYQTKAAVVEVLLKYPELMQRPIIIKNGRAVIARPPEKLLPMLD
jgi:arsenate reductase (glutaredoxin)